MLILTKFRCIKRLAEHHFMPFKNPKTSNKFIALILLFTTVLVSCKTGPKNQETTISSLDIAKNYYQALDRSDSAKMQTLVGDSIVVRERPDNYQEQFSNQAYTIWLEWDSVFQPTYKILEIAQENQVVKAKILKTDKRLLFLTQEPVVWNEIVHFNDNNKIVKVERTNYEVFNVSKFIKNRDTLVSWIGINHPELNGFLYPQTKSVGIKYLEAIQLYKNKN